MATRTGRKTSLGKHIGHAVEAHCRGVVRQIAGDLRLAVSRQSDLNLPVDTDIVLTTTDGRVKAIVIVAFNSEGADTGRRIDHSSHKFYRTRLEYNEVLRLRADRPTAFDRHFTVLTVIYGARRGWKEQLLAELHTQCAPMLFLPDTLGDAVAQEIADAAYQKYIEVRSKQTQHVEDHYSSVKLTGPHARLRTLIETTLDTGWRQTNARQRTLTPAGSGAKSIEPFRSRIRQGLSLAALFPDDECEAWLSRDRRGFTAPPRALESFVRRGVLLDLLAVSQSKSIVGSRIVASPRIPFDGSDYLPHRPDFDDWSRVRPGTIRSILTVHRSLPLQAKSFFAGGQDQVFGNLHSICSHGSSSLPALARAIRAGEASAVQSILGAPAHNIGPEPWHPCAAGAFAFSLPWSFAVATAATLADDRGQFRRYGFRSNEPHPQLQADLTRHLLSEANGAAQLLVEAATFLVAVRDDSLSKLCTLKRPRLLDLDVSTSWVAAAFLAVTTNPSHNPLAVAVHKFALKQGLSALLGFPEKRGAAVSQALGVKDCRIEWTIIGTDHKGRRVFLEPRSITANHVGDKSKEVFDRIGQTRAAAQRAGETTHLVGVLDGDFAQPTLSEMTSRIGYDEVSSIDAILEAI